MLPRVARTIVNPARSSLFPRICLNAQATKPFSSPFTCAHSTKARTMAPDLPSDRRPIVISGPSGVGKGTLFKMLFAQHPDTFTLSVSHTTRSPRDGERHAVDYHFVSHADFESLIAADGFVEHAKFGGNRYGTSKSTIREQTEKGKVVVLDIEMEGVKQIKASSIPARFVFVAPPNEDELEKRLRGRGTEKEESIQKRLAQAKYVIFGRALSALLPLIPFAGRFY